MAHSSKIFDRQPIRVQNLNGFDLSHLNCGTAYCGTLTPVLCRMLMPGTKFSLGASMNVELPPLATQAFGRIDAHIEVFWCPASILYGGWKQFISNNPETSFILTQALEAPYALPVFELSNATVWASWISLRNSNKGVSDYLGFRPAVPASGTLTGTFNILPMLCYHRIWDVFYRNPQVTRTIFAVNPDTSGNGFSHNVSFINHSYYRYGTTSNPTGSDPVFVTSSDLTFPDGKSIFEMRQRNWPNDYYTAGSVDPQQGNPSALNFTVDLNTGDGEFTIASLRAANSLQKFLEANNYDPTYRGVIRANFGVSPGDADLDEPIYLGRLVVPVYQKGVYVNSTIAYGENCPVSKNPFIDDSISFGTTGAKVASGSFNGEGSIVENFKVTSFGYVMGLFSLVPHAQYSYGIDRHWFDIEIGDYPFPLLQSVGMDSVKDYELYATNTNITGNTDFSYIPRYSRWKYVDDTTHGELSPGRSLQSFVIDRRFSSSPQFSTAFCEIPVGAIDEILPSDSDTMKFTCWYEIFWVFKAVMPLAEFCVPTLGELQDTHEINVKQGGSRL